LRIAPFERMLRVFRAANMLGRGRPWRVLWGGWLPGARSVSGPPSWCCALGVPALRGGAGRLRKPHWVAAREHRAMLERRRLWSHDHQLVEPAERLATFRQGWTGRRQSTVRRI
jgi:hypothetical protein